MIAQSAARPSQPVSPRRDAALVARMADFMIRQTAGDGSVTGDNLLLEFSEQEIDTHFDAAKALARKAGRVRS